jgi:hypothetical protein
MGEGVCAGVREPATTAVTLAIAVAGADAAIRCFLPVEAPIPAAYLHFHMLFIDGVDVEDDFGKPRFHREKAPEVEELKALVHTISHRVARFLEEKRGFLKRDAETSYLALEPDDDDTMVQLQGHSITYLSLSNSFIS